jgi:hypothetical protein
MSLNLGDVMHIVERLTMGPSDVIAPVGIVSSFLPIEKQLIAVTPELMPESSPNFNHRYI